MVASGEIQRGTKRLRDEGQQEEAASSITRLVERIDEGSAPALAKDEELLNAINAFKEATDRVTTLASEHIPAVLDRYDKGETARGDLSLIRALSASKAAASKMLQVFEKLQSRLRLPLINRFPNEILIEIFRWVQAENLGVCMSTCPRWNTVLKSKPVLWRRMFHLAGNSNKIVTKLESIHSLSGGQISMLSIEVKECYSSDLPTDDSQWESLRFKDLFPYDTLTEFKCRGKMNFMTKKIWSCITTCSQLKVLHWDTRGKDYDPTVNFCFASPLASCRLEEFVWKFCDHTFKFGADFLEILGQVKRLRLDGQFSLIQLQAILTTVENTIEELTLPQSPVDQQLTVEDDNHFLANVVKKDELTFNRMKLLTANRSLSGPCSIKDPQVERIYSNHSAFVPWDLIDSCHCNLKAIHVRDIHNDQSGSDLRESLLYLPVLEELELHFKKAYAPDRFYQQREYNFYALWNAIETQSFVRADMDMPLFLPNLRSLIITYDRRMDETLLAKFVKLRSNLNLNPIERMRILFTIVPLAQDVNIVYLKETVPDFKYNIDWVI